MHIVFGRYPHVSLADMKQWTTEAGKLSPYEAEIARHRLDGTVAIRIRRA